MTRLAISNQRGGIGKTTSALTLARCFADDGKKVLLIDTDTQGSIYLLFDLRQKAKGWLHQLLLEGLSLEEVVTPLHSNIDLICSDRRSARIEGELAMMPAREMIFHSRLGEAKYDVILFDTAPAISSLHTCAIAYAKNVLCPVGMDTLSLEGIAASLQTIRLLNQFSDMNARCVGFLPTQVDRRYSLTNLVLEGLRAESEEKGVPILHPIRTDQALNRASTSGQFVQDFDPSSKGLEDYRAAYAELKLTLDGKNGQQR
jgi:chromosome partitioning protein